MTLHTLFSWATCEMLWPSLAWSTPSLGLGGTGRWFGLQRQALWTSPCHHHLNSLDYLQILWHRMWKPPEIILYMLYKPLLALFQLIPSCRAPSNAHTPPKTHSWWCGGPSWQEPTVACRAVHSLPQILKKKNRRLCWHNTELELIRPRLNLS